MNCEAVDEALAAYIVFALDEDEAAAVREHLAGCHRHDEALADFGVVASGLALAPEEREAPARLRTRLLDQLDAGGADERGQNVTRPAGWFGLPRPALAIAALLLIAIGLATWNVVLQVGSDSDDGPTRVEFAGEAGSGELLYLKDEGLMVIDLDLPPSPEGLAYQVWGIHETQIVSLGFADYEATTTLAGDLEGAISVAISVEPEGGSEQPTTEPVLVANLD